MNECLKKLVLINKEVEAFKKTYPEFHLELIKIINSCTDGYMLEKGFSLKIRNLFRILMEDDCDKIKINSKDYNLLKKHVSELMFKDFYGYIDFVDLVKNHVRSGSDCIGYNTFARLLYGEPPLSIYNNNPGIRQAFYVSKLLIEFAEVENNISILNNLNEINKQLIKKVYPETCFTDN